jgi:hypothetical protein
VCRADATSMLAVDCRGWGLGRVPASLWVTTGRGSGSGKGAGSPPHCGAVLPTRAGRSGGRTALTRRTAVAHCPPPRWLLDLPRWIDLPRSHPAVLQHHRRHWVLLLSTRHGCQGPCQCLFPCCCIMRGRSSWWRSHWAPRGLGLQGE